MEYNVILKNAIRCKKCGDIIESTFQHDYRNLSRLYILLFVSLGIHIPMSLIIPIKNNDFSSKNCPFDVYIQ